MNLFSKYNFFHFKKRNVILFSVFLVLAFLFLMLTKFSQSFTQKIELKVELTNLNDEIILQNDSLSNAYVTVKGKGFSLLSYIFNSKKTIEIDANIETLKQKDYYLWDIKNKKYKLAEAFGKSIEILNVTPDTLRFNYDVLASKIIPIRLDKNISYSIGYDVIDNLKLSQDSVKIVGSKSSIKSLDFISTELLELNQVSKDISIDLKLKTSIPNIDIIPNKVTVSGKVVRFTEGKFTLPVKLKNSPKNKIINIFPKNIDLIYYVDIENFKRIKASDFEISCDFKNINSNQSTLEVDISKKSALVKSNSLSQHTVEFIISDL